MNNKKIAISVGDVNGIGLQLILENHMEVSQICRPVYCINKDILSQAADLLNMDIPDNFRISNTKGEFTIKPGKVSKKSGQYSYDSFKDAIEFARDNLVDGICTMPIHKEAWNKAGIDYVGHTDMLRDIFSEDAIMMLGCDKMYVALYTEHIPLKKVIKKIKTQELVDFLLSLYKSLSLEDDENIAVLGLNPHAGDNGVLGNEEKYIIKAINKTNKALGKDIFVGPMVPDVAFIPAMREKYKYFVAMYHDQGLAPLKALYFDEGINVSLNLRILRTSVDHGTAFDIAYKPDNNLSSKSYINAIKYIVSRKD